AGGLAFWLWDRVSQRPGGGTQTAKNVPLPAAPPVVDLGKLSDLDLVPRSALGFVSVRVADWWHSESGKKLQAQPARPHPEREFQQALVLSPGEVERITCVWTDLRADYSWAIVATTGPYDRDKLLTALGGTEQVTEGGQKYYTSTKNPRAALFFVNDRVLVI